MFLLVRTSTATTSILEKTLFLLARTTIVRATGTTQFLAEDSYKGQDVCRPLSAVSVLLRVASMLPQCCLSAASMLPQCCLSAASVLPPRQHHIHSAVRGDAALAVTS